MFLLYYPLKQGLKLFLFEYGLTDLSVFTLLSIKTRIETNIRVSLGKCSSMFLLYYPLKQGLKHSDDYRVGYLDYKFLLYYPLKQGLKHCSSTHFEHLLFVFTLLSIKTRIETA